MKGIRLVAATIYRPFQSGQAAAPRDQTLRHHCSSLPSARGSRSDAPGRFRKYRTRDARNAAASYRFTEDNGVNGRLRQRRSLRWAVRHRDDVLGRRPRKSAFWTISCSSWGPFR